MGWNRLAWQEGRNAHPLLDGVEPGAHVYFVHGYAAPVSEDTVGACSYGMDFTALVARGNFMGRSSTPSAQARWRQNTSQFCFASCEKGLKT